MRLRLKDFPLALALTLEVIALALTTISEVAYDWAEIPRKEK